MDRFIVRNAARIVPATSKVSISGIIDQCDSREVQSQQVITAVTPASGAVMLAFSNSANAPVDSDCTATQETGLFVYCLEIELCSWCLAKRDII